MAVRVLIVEDESIVALDLERRLTSLGFSVVGHARTGADAERLAREHRPDVVLMDIQIKGPQDGIETARHIRDELRIPSIFLTAYSDEESLDRAKRSQAYGYLLKPFQERELLIAIELARYKFNAERELEANRLLLDTTLNSIDEGVVTVGTDGAVLFSNDAAARLLALPRDRLIGVPLDEVMRTTSADVDDTLPGPPEELRRFTLERTDAPDIPIELLSAMIDGDAEGSAARVLVFRDISQSLQYERSLVKAKEAAEAAVRAKSDFLARISHELRTPLNSILGMVQLAEQIGGESQLTEYLGIMKSSARALMDLISDLLDYAKFENGRIQIRHELFSIHHLVDELGRTVAIQAHAKGLRISTIVSPELPARWYGDEERIRQILNNVLSNAIKFTGSGSVELVVEPTATGSGIRVAVIDTGIGIPAERHAQIFEDFSQIEDPATRRAGGTGLGLAIVKRLVDAMDGEITIRSEPSRGTEIAISLPMDVAGTERVIDAVEAEGESIQPLDQPARLMVEDPLLRRTLSRWIPGSETGAGTTGIVNPDPASANATDLVVLSTDADRSTVDRWDRICASETVHHPTVVLVDTTPSAMEKAYESCRFIRLREPLRQEEIFLLARGRADLLETAVPNVSVQPSGETRGSEGTVHPGTDQPRTVLIVDDDNLTLMVTKRLVERLGYDAHGVNRGTVALDVLRDVPFGAVCIDIEMPGMDGWELARRIRDGDAGPESARIPLIALTGYSRTDIAEELEESAFDGMLGKPVLLEELDERLKSAFQSAMREDPVSTSVEKLRTFIASGRTEEAETLIRTLKAQTTSPDGGETLFRLQLALRRGDGERVAQLVRNLKA